MKKLIAIAVIGLIALAASAQTNTTTTNITQNLWQILTTGSNYWGTVEGTYSTGSHEWGADIQIGYHVSDALNPVARLDYFAGTAYVVSMNIQLSVPQTLLGKVPVQPYARAGVGTAFAGLGANNGNALGIIGGGAFVRFDWVGNAWLWQHLEILGGYEHWTGVDSKRADHITGGVKLTF